MRDQFYITLPSNSSMGYFPDNTTTRFTTRLPRHIELGGDWEVALAEIQYPLSFETVTEQFSSVRLHVHHTEKPETVFTDIAAMPNEKVSGTEYRIEPGVYTGTREIARALNTVDGLNGHIRFGCVDRDEERLLATRICSCKTGHYLSFSPNLYRHLGFDKLTSNIQQCLEANQPVDLLSGIPRQMFVYCDVVEPRIVGDVSAPLLRIVQTLGQNFRKGGSELRILSPPHYLPLMFTSFRTIEIDIRDSLGKPIPFTGGTLTVTLHFKRVN